ncbi:MAG: sensor histidine kinase N-terminal domain-containing protein [Chlamydiia bacterium]|nr:sensor histidine kinase N-terminal domain-containing protein [Chlamydiia bacterium]
MTRRLILWLTAALVAFWLVAALLGAVVMREEFDEVFDSALAETGQRLLPLVLDELSLRADGEDDDDEPRTIAAGEIPEHDEYLTYQVRASDGRVLLRSHDAEAAPFAAPLVPGFFDTPTQRIHTIAGAGGTVFLQVADPLEHRTEAVTEGAVALVLPLVALVPFSILVVWLIVRATLAPVGVLRAAIGERNGMNLAPLDAGALPPELAGIAASVDDLLRRLRAALEAERGRRK